MIYKKLPDNSWQKHEVQGITSEQSFKLFQILTEEYPTIKWLFLLTNKQKERLDEFLK